MEYKYIEIMANKDAVIDIPLTAVGVLTVPASMNGPGLVVSWWEPTRVPSFSEMFGMNVGMCTPPGLMVCKDCNKEVAGWVVTKDGMNTMQCMDCNNYATRKRD